MMPSLKWTIMTDDEKEFPFSHEGLIGAMNHEHFTLDRVCPKCEKWVLREERRPREEKFCHVCGTEKVAPTPCPGHQPGKVIGVPFPAVMDRMVFKMVPNWYAADGHLMECRQCGNVA